MIKELNAIYAIISIASIQNDKLFNSDRIKHKDWKECLIDIENARKAYEKIAEKVKDL